MIAYVKKGLLAPLLLSLSCAPLFGDLSLPALQTIQNMLDAREDRPEESDFSDPSEYRSLLESALSELNTAVVDTLTDDDIETIHSAGLTLVEIGHSVDMAIGGRRRYETGAPLRLCFSFLSESFNKQTENSWIMRRAFEAAVDVLDNLFKAIEQTTPHGWDLADGSLLFAFEVIHAMDRTLNAEAQAPLKDAIPAVILGLNECGYFMEAADLVGMLALLDELPQQERLRTIAAQSIEEAESEAAHGSLAEKATKVRELLAR